MSYIYRYKFVSPEACYASVKEELRSYFDTQAVDDIMFPIWTEKCLKKLGKSSFKISEALLFIDGFEAKLPPDFVSVREAWYCGEGVGPAVRSPGAYYEQISTVLNKPYDACDPASNCDPCSPEIVRVVVKTQTEESLIYTHSHLLKPGNISVRDHCDLGCLNYGSQSPDAFDIRDNKFISNFRCGDVHLTYYSSKRDDSGHQLIPDNYRIQEYIEAFLKYKIFEQLSNQTTDETFNQIERKKLDYKQMYDEAFIMADIEVKKRTIERDVYSIKKEQHRLDKYNVGIYNNRPYRRR